MLTSTSAMKSFANGSRRLSVGTVPRVVLLAPLLLALSCSESPTEPPSVVTLRVTNSSCEGGECSSYEIILIPANPPIISPGGPWFFELGTVSTSSACLTFPSSASYSLTEQRGEGVAVSKTEVGWTPRDPVYLGAMDAGFSWYQVHSSTDEFVPTKSGGWSITVPGGTDLSVAEPCES